MNVEKNFGENAEKYPKSVDTQGGLCCIAGTRIPIYLVIQLLASGWTYKRLCKHYPSLNKERILDALRYAAKLCEEDAKEDSIYEK